MRVLGGAWCRGSGLGCAGACRGVLAGGCLQGGGRGGAWRWATPGSMSFSHLVRLLSSRTRPQTSHDACRRARGPATTSGPRGNVTRAESSLRRCQATSPPRGRPSRGATCPASGGPSGRALRRCWHCPPTRRPCLAACALLFLLLRCAPSSAPDLPPTRPSLVTYHAPPPCHPLASSSGAPGAR